jgi:hypothetical protein
MTDENQVKNEIRRIEEDIEKAGVITEFNSFANIDESTLLRRSTYDNKD